ncbi:MAG TPA: diacylglycerol kinase family protein [Geminicoccaceae bacterium]|nr:diacylglycerol kinase family protein [Geminicoccaceae bacterium]
MKVAVFLNAAAGSLAGRTIEEEVARVAAAFRAAGVEADVRAVAGARMAATVRAAAGSDADAIVVGGGDGTISAAARALAGGEKPLGVLPLGTFNHFAKDLGVPLKLEDAARAVAQGVVRAVDVAEVNGRTFVNNSVLGIYAGVVRARDMQRRRLGRDRWVALFHAALGALRRFPMLRLRVAGAAAGGGAWRRTAFVFVGNNDYELPLYPSGGRASLERGRLSVYVATPSGRLATVLMALRALVGRPDSGRDLDRMLVPEVTIESRKRRLRALVDGEVVYMRPPLRYRIRPRALRVLTPPPDG